MKSKPTPIRIPSDLEAEIKAASELTGLPDQEVMRLAMRIGLVDLRAAKHIAGIIQEVATDKGVSFLSWAKEKSKPVEVEETTIEAAGTKLKLIAPAKASLTSHPEASKLKTEPCTSPSPASNAPSTAIAPKPARPRKPAANVARLPISHWGAADSKVAEETRGSSTGQNPLREEKA